MEMGLARKMELNARPIGFEIATSDCALQGDLGEQDDLGLEVSSIWVMFNYSRHTRS